MTIEESAPIEVGRSGWDYPCIFCLRVVPGNRSEEHIIPESGGNTAWVLPPGVVCDDCNHYFGEEVDKPFLESPGVSTMRPFAVSKTKSGKPPKSTFMNARLVGAKGDNPMRLELNDRDDFGLIEETFRANERDPETGKLRFKVPLKMRFTRKERNQVSRFLLKAGLEYLAFESLYDTVDPGFLFSERFDWARDWTRAPRNKKIIVPYATGSFGPPRKVLGLGLANADGILTVFVSMYGTLFVAALQQVSPSFYDQFEELQVVRNTASGPLSA